MMDSLALLIIFIGICVVTLGALGVLKFPDTLIRAAAGSKASTLGLMLAILGACLHSSSEGSRLRLTASLFMVFVTSPVAAHLLGRAALHSGLQLFSKTKNKELPEKFGFKTNKD